MRNDPEGARLRVVGVKDNENGYALGQQRKAEILQYACLTVMGLVFSQAVTWL